MKVDGYVFVTKQGVREFNEELDKTMVEMDKAGWVIEESHLTTIPANGGPFYSLLIFYSKTGK
jgi:hypothetical protein